MGTITALEASGTNISFWIQAAISQELKVDQSVSHNGVCLTVEEIIADGYKVTAIQETLSKTNLGSWKAGDLVNLERCLTPSGRLDGHFVQGHVDTTAVCIEKTDQNGSWLFRFEFPERFAQLVIEKGSISLNGISLTIFDITINQFSVAIIPYTIQHTNLNRLETGSLVNLEFDMVGKYVVRGREVGKLS